jgi:hypothetical protein
MRTQFAILTVALGLLIPASQTLAQRPQTREGFNLSFGFGGGSAGIDCSGCPTNRQSGTALFLNVGSTISRRLTLGGELNGLARSSQNEDDTFGSLMAVAHFYPAPAMGLFLIGGAGMTSMSLDNHVDLVNVTSTGLGAQLGAGYDIRLGRNFSLTPYASYVKGFAGMAKVNGVSADEKVTPNYAQIGLGFTWH